MRFHFSRAWFTSRIFTRTGASVSKAEGAAAFRRLNFGTIAAFLAWFGGTGYLLERYSNVWVYLGLFISMMSGLGGAAAVFWFLMKLVGQDRPLDPADYEMTGVLGRVASPIRQGGTGELIYARDGARCCTPARSRRRSRHPARRGSDRHTI